MSAIAKSGTKNAIDKVPELPAAQNNTTLYLLAALATVCVTVIAVIILTRKEPEKVTGREKVSSITKIPAEDIEQEKEDLEVEPEDIVPVENFELAEKIESKNQLN